MVKRPNRSTRVLTVLRASTNVKDREKRKLVLILHRVSTYKYKNLQEKQKIFP